MTQRVARIRAVASLIDSFRKQLHLLWLLTGRKARALGLGIGILLMTAAASAMATHKIAHNPPSAPADRGFPTDFAPLEDDEWSFPLGGFGGESRRKAITHNPVIFVHGNTADASFWKVAVDSTLRVDVPARFRAAGYIDQEIWALSYNGASCGTGNTAGCGTANDVNVPDFFNFLEAVRDYTGASKVDVVAHSLGVTIVRKAIHDHPELLNQIEDFVGAAGANHGTSACRGLEDTWFGCDEIAPGTQWLAALNSWNPNGEADETPGPIRYMTIYDGTGAGDISFTTIPNVQDDSQSPRLSGADNRTIPNGEHTSLGRGEAAVTLYLSFVKDHNVVTLAEPDPKADDVRVADTLAATGPPAALNLIGSAMFIAGILVLDHARGGRIGGR